MSVHIGLLSGTSVDALDAAVVDFDAPSPRLLVYREFPLEKDLRQRLLELGLGSRAAMLGELGPLHVRLGRAFAQAAREVLDLAGLSPQDVAGIGLHGQTVAHQPEGETPFSWQLGDANIVAALTGVTTVADFRGMDLACGGQGAPLAPAFHAAVFRRPGVARVIVNIGGIANVSVLPADPGSPVRGFDTGPGNSLLDAWAQRHLGEPFDRDGGWARQGEVDTVLLDRLLADGFFARSAPKSACRSRFGLGWLEAALAQTARSPRPRDTQATLLALTARTIAGAITTCAPETTEVRLCGGGAKNPALVEALREALGPDRQLDSTSALGIAPEAVEAVLFAWLARERLAGRAIDLREISGSTKPVLLGAVYAPPP